MAQAERIRTAMGPDLRAVADALREQFGAKLAWLKTPALEVGSEPEWGVPTQINPDSPERK
jgi:hypothetical protein